MMSYGGDLRRGEVMNEVNWICTGIATFVVTLRVLSRTVFSHSFGLDDALMVLSTAILIAYSSTFTAAVSLGYGQHTWDVPEEQRPAAMHMTLCATCISVVTFSVPKLAVVALIQRIFPLKLWLRILFWAIAFSLVGCTILLSIFWYVQCTPFAHQWDPVHVQGICWDASIVGNFSYFVAAFSAFCDVLWAVYPPFIVRTLKVPTYKKLFVCVALGQGLLAAICAFYKITTLETLSAKSRDDPLWSDAPLFFWTMIEDFFLIVGASLPTLGHIVHYFRGRSIGNPEGSSSETWPRLPSRKATDDGLSKPAKQWSTFRASLMNPKDGIGYAHNDDIHLIQTHCRRATADPLDPDVLMSNIRKSISVHRERELAPTHAVDDGNWPLPAHGRLEYNPV